MIPEPHLTYLLELFAALGPVADDFVVVGAQAMKFILERARATKDFDFILDVVALREEPLLLKALLQSLGYEPVNGARNFQFEKAIPNSSERMRIEFMGADEFKRRNNIRVNVQDGIHARACEGGGIALAESDPHTLSGRLPNGDRFTAKVRVTRPHALVMLKLLALDDRYKNVRGPGESRHDREEAQTHAADAVAIVTAQPDAAEFRRLFEQQFRSDMVLGIRVLRLLSDYFHEPTGPGLLVYGEYVAASQPADRETLRELRQETERAHRVMSQILPNPEFCAVAAAVEDSCDWEANPLLVEDYLSGLEKALIPIHADLALQLLPASAFGGSYKPGEKLVTAASEALRSVSVEEADLLRGYLVLMARNLGADQELRRRFPHALPS